MLNNIKPIRQAITQAVSIKGIPAQDQDMASQGIVQAMLNCGRWMVMCPDDPLGMHAGEVTLDQATFICPGCYPDIRAIGLTQVSEKLWRPVPDMELRQAAIDQANADGRAYTIQFPDNAADILLAVRQRPTGNMNWLPGETLDFLNQENTDNDVGATQPDTTVSGGN